MSDNLNVASPKNGRTWRRRKNRRRCMPDAHSVLCCPILIKLSQWLQSKQRYTLKMYLKPTIFATTGRGLMTVNGLKCGDLVVSIPREALVTCDTVVNDELLGGILRSSGLKLRAMEVLTIFLIYHRCLGEESYWKPYIDSIPLEYSVPAYCSENEINIMPEFLNSYAMKQAEDLKQCHEKTITILCNLMKPYRRDFSPSLDDVKWGWFTVNTRAVYLKNINPDPILADDDIYALAPYLDLLNHSHIAQVKTGINESNGCYEIHTLVPYGSHEQVFINYGPHDNITLFREYGFIIPNNPHNSVPLNLEDVKCEMKHLDMKRERKTMFYEKQKIITTNGIHKHLGVSLEGPSWNLEVVVTIFLMTPEELHEWQMIYQNLHAVVFRSLVIECLQMVCQRKLNNMKSVLNDMESIEVCTNAFDCGKKLVQECCDILHNTVIT